MVHCCCNVCSAISNEQKLQFLITVYYVEVFILNLYYDFIKNINYKFIKHKEFKLFNKNNRYHKRGNSVRNIVSSWAIFVIEGCVHISIFVHREQNNTDFLS